MLDTAIKSKNDAKTALLLGHTSSGMGEKVLALKFKKILDDLGYSTSSIIDIIELLGEAYEPLAQLNYDLADGGYSLIEDLRQLPDLPQSNVLIILSWCFSLAALFATRIHKSRFTAVKLFVHHTNERILSRLYEPADLLLTESLLAHERALVYGIHPSKLLYLPHCYPSICEKLHANRHYVYQLAKRQGKTIGKNTKIIGCVSRLEYGKNCEFALEAVRRLVAQKEDVVLVLKGDFPIQSPYPEYKPLLQKMLQIYSQEPWLLWDKEFTPYPKVVEDYASFDVLLHPSGAEGASHVVIECLGLKKPVVLLNCSTNPYLFRDLVTFVNTTGAIRAASLPFYIPDLDDLCLKMKQELKIPEERKVRERFHEDVLKERMHLLFEPNPEQFKKLYEYDLKCYNL